MGVEGAARCGETEVCRVGDVQCSGGLAVDGVVDGGLEPGQVHHEVGVGHVTDRLWGELEVVWLDAGRREVGDLHGIPCEALDHELQGIETDHHRRLPAGAVVAAASEGQRTGQRRAHQRDDRAGGGHDPTLTGMGIIVK